MRFLHLGDLHLGKSLGDFDLIDDQKYILNQILEMIDREKIDGILLAGDIYDKAIPSEAATGLLDYFLLHLSQKGIYTFMISGNHDSDERLNYGSSLFSANRIYISSKFNGSLAKYVLEDEQGPVNVFLLPFVKASQVRHFYPDEQIDTYEDAIRIILQHTELNRNERNIIVAHQFVIGGEGQELQLGGSEGPSVRNVGLVDSIGYHCFDDFDYVALGHIHSPQAIGKETVRYSGSPLKYSLSEVNNQKSVPVITMEEKGNTTICLEPLVPQRDLRHITGRMEALLRCEDLEGIEDFIYVTLTDDDEFDNVMAIFQQKYPNTIKIDYDNQFSRAVPDVDMTDFTLEVPFSELISEYYRSMCNMDISENELTILQQLAEEVGLS